MDSKKDKKYDRQRRHRFTINNPFITDDVTILDLDNLTDTQKSILERTPPKDYSYIKDNDKFKDLFEFHLCEYPEKKDEVVVDWVVGERAFFKSYEHAQTFFASQDFINYVCFQYEQGEKGGNKHLQGFMNYKSAMYFHKVKHIFPPIHLDRCYKPSEYYRDYCMKQQTKIDGFDCWENKEWQDDLIAPTLDGFFKDVLAMKSTTELAEGHGKLSFLHHKKVEPFQQDLLKEKFGDKKRDVHVTYIYGKEGAGKSTYYEHVLKIPDKNVCLVGDYEHSGKFDGYQTQDVIIFNEFDSQIKITKMNQYLDGRPNTYLPARNINKLALYTKVFVISNYPLDDLYKKERADGKEPSFRGFKRRFKEIIYMPDFNTYVWQLGRPSDEVIATLEQNKAKFKLLPQDITQLELDTQGGKNE